MAIPGIHTQDDQADARRLVQVERTLASLAAQTARTPCPPIHLTGQNATISATTVYTPLVAGRFRVSAYLRTGTAGAAGTVLVTLSWIDEVGAKSKASATIALTGANQLDLTAFIYAAASGAIKYATTVVGLVGATYDLDVLVEKLP